MTGPLTTIKRLRDHHGDDCWLCGTKMDFAAVPNSKKAPTREHLVALSLGGTSAFDNLVLCHPGCNRHLGDRDVADKKRMRDKARANRAKQLASGSGTKAHGPATSAGPAKALVPGTTPIAPKAPKAKPRIDTGIVPDVTSGKWQRIALMTSGAALFLAGLAIGLLSR